MAVSPEERWAEEKREREDGLVIASRSMALAEEEAWWLPLTVTERESSFSMGRGGIKLNFCLNC